MQSTLQDVGPLAAGMPQIQRTLDQAAKKEQTLNVQSLLQRMRSSTKAAEAEKEAKFLVEELDDRRELANVCSQILRLDTCLPFEARRRFRSVLPLYVEEPKRRGQAVTMASACTL